MHCGSSSCFLRVCGAGLSRQRHSDGTRSQTVFPRAVTTSSLRLFPSLRLGVGAEEGEAAQFRAARHSTVATVAIETETIPLPPETPNVDGRRRANDRT
jgi:hypothetical protein